MRRDKAELFHFDLEDIKNNLEVHREVLSELSIHYSGADMFEDYQGIYDEMVKNVEREERFRSHKTDTETKIIEGSEWNKRR